MASRENDRIDLAEAVLLIAAEEYPRLDVQLYIEKIDRLGEMARAQVQPARGALDTILTLNSFLFVELEFHGNSEDYGDPRNSFLNEVIDRRMGIPITLTVLYMEVAKRVGLLVEGVSLPLHFIARHSSDTGEFFIDPYNGGRVMDREGCAELLSRMSDGRIELQPEHLAPATRKQILTRMLTNLLSTYAGAGEFNKALAAIDRILLIHPDSPTHVRDRGLLLAAKGEIRSAQLELERYLALSPAPADEESIREQIKTIRQSLAKLN